MAGALPLEVLGNAAELWVLVGKFWVGDPPQPICGAVGPTMDPS